MNKCYLELDPFGPLVHVVMRLPMQRLPISGPEMYRDKWNGFKETLTSHLYEHDIKLA